MYFKKNIKKSLISNIFCSNLLNKSESFPLNAQPLLESQNPKLKKRTFEEFFEENIIEKPIIKDESYFADKEEIEKIKRKSDVLTNPLILAETYKEYICGKERYLSNKNDFYELRHWIYEEFSERKILEDIFQMILLQESEIFELILNEKYEYKIFQQKIKCQVSHLTPLSLEQIMKNFIDMANSLQEIDFLIKELMESTIKGKVFLGFINEIAQIKEDFSNYVCSLQLIFFYQSHKSNFFKKIIIFKAYS